MIFLIWKICYICMFIKFLGTFKNMWSYYLQKHKAAIHDPESFLTFTLQIWSYNKIFPESLGLRSILTTNEIQNIILHSLLQEIFIFRNPGLQDIHCKEVFLKKSLTNECFFPFISFPTTCIFSRINSARNVIGLDNSIIYCATV